MNNIFIYILEGINSNIVEYRMNWNMRRCLATRPKILNHFKGLYAWRKIFFSDTMIISESSSIDL